MIDLNRAVGIGIRVALLGIVVLAVVLYANRPTPADYRVAFEFERRPTAAERDETVRVLEARLAEFADPAWDAAVGLAPDSRIVLTWHKTGGPGALADEMFQRGVAEFRFLHPDQRLAPDAVRDGPPDGYEVVPYLETCLGFDESTNKPIRKEIPALVEKDVIIRPASFRSVTFRTEGLIQESHLRIEFEPGDVERLVAARERLPDRPVALIVDGCIRVGFRKLGPVDDGAIETAGLLDNEPVSKLAKLLRHGPLPVPLRRVEDR